MIAHRSFFLGPTASPEESQSGLPGCRGLLLHTAESKPTNIVVDVASPKAWELPTVWGWIWLGYRYLLLSPSLGRVREKKAAPSSTQVGVCS